MPHAVRLVCKIAHRQPSFNSLRRLHTVALRGHSESSSKTIHHRSASRLLSGFAYLTLNSTTIQLLLAIIESSGYITMVCRRELKARTTYKLDNHQPSYCCFSGGNVRIDKILLSPVQMAYPFWNKHLLVTTNLSWSESQ